MDKLIELHCKKTKIITFIHYSRPWLILRWKLVVGPRRRRSSRRRRRRRSGGGGAEEEEEDKEEEEEEL